MSMGLLAGALNTNAIGSSLIGGLAYSANQSMNQVIPSDGSGMMTTFSYLVIPLVDFSPTTVMTLPTVSTTATTGGVRVIASGGSIPAQILVFGR